MEDSQPNKRDTSAMRRLGPPILCGLVGIFITIVIGNIPHNYSIFALGVSLVIFIVAHLIWFHKVIQSLRDDFHKSEGRPKIPSLALGSQRGLDEDQTHEILIEATFFQLLRERLNGEHPPHIEALSLQDNKKHLIQTSSLVTLLRENQLEILAEPIVTLPQKRVTFFSCLPCATIENGMLINMNTVSGTAKYLSFFHALDRMTLFLTLQFVRRHHATHPTHGFICSLPPSIYEDRASLEEFCDFLHNSHFPIAGMIFEIPLNIPKNAFNNLSRLTDYGVRFIGKWQGKVLPDNLTDINIPSVDFIRFPFSDVLMWINRHPRRQSLASLQQALEFSPQVIISGVDQEQDFHHKLPLPFDYGSGQAFGVPKPLCHIQVRER